MSNHELLFDPVDSAGSTASVAGLTIALLLNNQKGVSLS